jgi:uncharacterized damage-inducible protein DinB
MTKFLVVPLLSLMCCVAAIAQDKPKEKPGKATVASVLDHQLSSLEKELVSLAEAMPEDKFEFAPTEGEFKGVRTFGTQVRHIAATNLLVAAALLGEKSPFDPKLDNGPAEIKSREESLKFLKDSFAQAHKAMATINQKNATEMVQNPWSPEKKMPRLDLGTILNWHSYDHYGQMVVYLRMNGVVPPASRQQ